MRIVEPTKAQERAWRKWVGGLPPIARATAAKLDIWTLYRMKDTGQRATIAAIQDDGKVRVDITGQYNMVMFDRSVFGIDPGNLEPCDVPGILERTGVILSDDEVEANKDILRVIIRPDLFRLTEDGDAVRLS